MMQCAQFCSLFGAREWRRVQKAIFLISAPSFVFLAHTHRHHHTHQPSLSPHSLAWLQYILPLLWLHLPKIWFSILVHQIFQNAISDDIIWWGTAWRRQSGGAVFREMGGKLKETTEVVSYEGVLGRPQTAKFQSMSSPTHRNLMLNSFKEFAFDGKTPQEDIKRKDCPPLCCVWRPCVVSDLVHSDSSWLCGDQSAQQCVIIIIKAGVTFAPHSCFQIGTKVSSLKASGSKVQLIISNMKNSTNS